MREPIITIIIYFSEHSGQFNKSRIEKYPKYYKKKAYLQIGMYLEKIEN